MRKSPPTNELVGVGFVTAAGCDVSREGTVSGFDGVIAVIDANFHIFCRDFVFR